MLAQLHGAGGGLAAVRAVTAVVPETHVDMINSVIARLVSYLANAEEKTHA
jgi:hypothetical protein